MLAIALSHSASLLNIEPPSRANWLPQSFRSAIGQCQSLTGYWRSFRVFQLHAALQEQEHVVVASMRAQAYPGENPLNNPTPEEIMPVYLYLMGPDSTGINGQAFNAQ